jgi:hypothetical protein
MSRPNWKRTERRIAEELGGQRVPVTGRQRGDAPDIAHPTFAIEVKHRASLPQWLLDACNQAQACRRGDQVPIVILHMAGWHHGQDLVCIRMADFKRLSTLAESIEVE